MQSIGWVQELLGENRSQKSLIYPQKLSVR